MMDYALNFTAFMAQVPEPTLAEFAEWNRLRMLDCIACGDAHNAKVYATELVHLHNVYGEGITDDKSIYYRWED